jgi:hypothetical protein
MNGYPGNVMLAPFITASCGFGRFRINKFNYNSVNGRWKFSFNYVIKFI